ncbi:hypothetical protein EDC04DRAFT_3093090 [Pisolithus marmoratus]|nr:hypothetical protein EDC04DRAFT_3093090 [Pisolithus marmoratus]
MDGSAVEKIQSCKSIWLDVMEGPSTRGGAQRNVFEEEVNEELPSFPLFLNGTTPASDHASDKGLNLTEDAAVTRTTWGHLHDID